jgi:TM2 domain-containing membrane protein YozV
MSSRERSDAGRLKWAAGLLGIFLGAFGLHKFVLGYSRAGLIMLGVSILGGAISFGGASFVMGVIGLIEGVIYLTKSPEEFESTYLRGSREWF